MLINALLFCFFTGKESKKQPRINLKTLGQRLDMVLVQAALTGQYPRHHGFRADLGEIGGGKLMLGHEQAQCGLVGGLLHGAVAQFEGCVAASPISSRLRRVAS